MSAERRRQLGEFLRSRRARLRPEEVGISADGVRRTEGLRREEVAGLAGVSTSWYTYLEQGRDVRPSVQVLDAVARVLRLDPDEVRFLQGFADDAPDVAVPADLAPIEIVTSLVRLDDDSPYPTYAFDAYCDLVAWNPATTTYFTDFGLLAPGDRNMMWWLIASDEARERLTDWHSDVRDVVARWRRMSVGADPARLASRVAAYKERSTDFARWWDSHDIREHHTRLRHFAHPELGPVTLRVIVVGSPEFAGRAVAFHAPVDPRPPGR